MATAFTPEQAALLSAPLSREHVRQRSQGSSSLSYLEGWHVIAEANRIFGFDGWQRETLQLCCVNQSERKIGRDQKPGWGVSYMARVRVIVGDIIREGSGAGHGIDVDLGQAHESALKEAETDAMKRALMTFGNPFGLALYDKQQREVTGGNGAQPAGRQPSRQPTRQAPPRPANTAPAPNPEKVLADVTAAVERSALTLTGKLALIHQLTGGEGRALADIRPDWLEKVPTVIVRPESVERLNAGCNSKTGEPLDLPAIDDDMPATWAVEPQAVPA